MFVAASPALQLPLERARLLKVEARQRLPSGRLAGWLTSGAAEPVQHEIRRVAIKFAERAASSRKPTSFLEEEGVKLKLKNPSSRQTQTHVTTFGSGSSIGSCRSWLLRRQSGTTTKSKHDACKIANLAHQQPVACVVCHGCACAIRPVVVVAIVVVGANARRPPSMEGRRSTAAARLFFG